MESDADDVIIPRNILLGGACSTSIQFSTDASSIFARSSHRTSRNRRKRLSKLPDAVFQTRKSSTRRRPLWNSGHSADARPQAARVLQQLWRCFSARGNNFNHSPHAFSSGNCASLHILFKLAKTSVRAARPMSSDADNGEGKRKAVKACTQECRERYNFMCSFTFARNFFIPVHGKV